MPKTILLARPHPFIVNEMKPLLINAGFDIKGVTAEDGLAATDIKTCAAAVISLAVVSPINMSPPQVLKALKSGQFKGKIIFAGLVPFERVENNLKQFLADTGWHIDVRALSSASASQANAVYVQQSDLAAPSATASRNFLTAWV